MRANRATASLCLIVALSLCGFADAGLVGYWRFDEGEGRTVRDSSGKGNHGEIVGARWVEGVHGFGLEFTGDANCYVEVPHSDSLSPTDAVTVTAWAKVHRWNPFHSCLVYKKNRRHVAQDYTDRSYTLWLWQGGGLHFTSTPDSLGRQIHCDLPGNFYPAGEFTHFALVVDCARKTMTAYVNGKVVGRIPYPGDRIRGGKGPLRLGGFWLSHVGQAGLTGVLDEVRIFSHALAAQEIADDMASGKVGQPPTSAGDAGSSEAVILEVTLIDTIRPAAGAPSLSPHIQRSGTKGESTANDDGPTSPPELSVLLLNAPSTAVLNRLEMRGRLDIRLSEVLSAKPGETSQLELLGSDEGDQDFRATVSVDVLDWEKRILDVHVEFALGNSDADSGSRASEKRNARYFTRSGKTAVLALGEVEREKSRVETLALIRPTLIGGEWRARLKETQSAAPPPYDWPVAPWYQPGNGQPPIFLPDGRQLIQGGVPHIVIPNPNQGDDIVVDFF